MRDLSRRVEEPVAPLVTDPADKSLAPPPAAIASWWHRRSAALSALGVLGVVIALAIGMALREDKPPDRVVAGSRGRAFRRRQRRSVAAGRRLHGRADRDPSRSPAPDV